MISKDNKIIANYALQAFGGNPKVSKYWDESHVSSIDVLSTAGRPYEGVTSYSTIGLSDHSMAYIVDGTPLRVEIVGASASKFKHFPNVLATCAFCMINSNFIASHGKVFQDVIGMYDLNSNMKHVLFVSPFLWGNLETLDFPNKKVAWLLAVPISGNEYVFAREKGTDSLEKLFEEKEIDIFNLERKSIL